MNVKVMLLRAPCPGPGGGIRGTGRAGGTGCPVPGQRAGNTGSRAPPAPQDLMIYRRRGNSCLETRKITDGIAEQYR